MKRAIILLLVLTFMIALISGCQQPENNGVSPEPGNTVTVPPAATNSGSEGGDDPAPIYDDAVYNYAVNTDGTPKYAVNDEGYSIEPYNYELPLTTSDETFRFMHIQWLQDLYPAEADGDYARTPYPQETLKKTGVDVEYITLNMETFVTQFGVAMASGDLPELMSYTNTYYTEKPLREGILSEGYWINLYDYKQYAPNFYYQGTKDPNDMNSMYRMFPEPGLTYGFYVMWDVPTRSYGLFARGDWMDEYRQATGKLQNMNDDMRTVEDWHDILTWCKVEGKSANPHFIYTTIDNGASLYNFYDTYSMINTPTPQFVVDGEVQFAQTTPGDLKLAELFNTWIVEGITDPAWMSYTMNEDIDHGKFDTEYLIIQATSNGAAEHNTQLYDQSPNSDYGWIPIPLPVLETDQTLHMGAETSRIAGTVIGVSAEAENIPLVVTWCDWKYSDEGIILNTYGVEGVSYEMDENGVPQLTELVYNNPRMSLTMLAILYMQNTFCDPGLKLSYGQWQFPGSEVPDAFDMWASIKYDGAYTWPTSLALTADQLERVNGVLNDVKTFITENFTMFISGDKPFSEYDAYVAEVNELGVNVLKQTYQNAYDDWLAING